MLSNRSNPSNLRSSVITSYSIHYTKLYDSDYVMREAGIAHKFFAYTENIHREKAARFADHITPNLDEFLFVNKSYNFV